MGIIKVRLIFDYNKIMYIKEVRIAINRLKYSPICDPLRDHPRFQELLKKYEEKG